MILIKEIPMKKEIIKVGIYKNDHLVGFSEWSIVNKQQTMDDIRLNFTVSMEKIILDKYDFVLFDALFRGSLNVLVKKGFPECLIRETLWNQVNGLFQSKGFIKNRFNREIFYRININDFFKKPCKGMIKHNEPSTS